MARYIIPVKINSRKYVSLHFYQDKSVAADKESRFVCSLPRMGSGLELFSFRDDLRATSDGCTKDDRRVIPTDIECKDVQADDYTIHLQPIDDSEQKAVSNTRSVKLALAKTDVKGLHALKFDYNSMRKAGQVTLHLQLHLPDGDWHCFLLFDLVPQDDMYSLVLDFGSEASQGLCLPQKAGEIQFTLPFINLAKKYICPEYAGMTNASFHQYQNDREQRSDLFRSLFYVEDKTPLFLSLLTDDNRLKQMRKQLPNIKLALLNNEPENIIPHYSNIVLNFIISACYKIIESRTEMGDDKTIGLQLELLVPNVMSMSTTRRLISSLQDKFHCMMDVPQLSRFCLEINAFSESDASFRGYFYNHRDKNLLHANRSYLMIDAGKGTLDFSVISIQNREKFYSYYRDGFVGSGNAVTYALFDHICAVIAGFTNNHGRKQLMQNLLFGTQTDQLGLRRLLNVLESIKAAVPNPNTAKRNCESLKNELGQGSHNLNLEKLVEHLEKNPGDYGDQFGIIHATCDKICMLLVNNLLDNHIISSNMPKHVKIEEQPACRFDEVILAGRAFRYPMFLQTLCTHMERYFGIQKANVRFDSGMAKIGCLYGLLQCHLVNSNCGLTGVPSIGRVLLTDNEESKKQHRNFEEDIDLFIKLGAGNDGDTYVKTEPVTDFTIDSNFLNKGYDITIASNQVLRMNGHEMQYETKMYGEHFNLFYDGTDLLLRNEANVSPLRRSVAQIPVQSTLIFESRFPNYEPADKSSLRYFFFPELNKSDYHEE